MHDVIKRIIERAEKTCGTISDSDKQEFYKHDITDPFCITYIKKRSYSGDIFIYLRGNQLQCSGVTTWFDLAGEEIKPDIYRSAAWNVKRADQIAHEIRCLGRAAVSGYSSDFANKTTDRLKDDRIMIRSPDHNRPGMSSTYSYYLIVSWHMVGISGKISEYSFRIDSYGIPGIAEKIIERIDLLKNLMPKTPEEAAKKAEEVALNYIEDKFRNFDLDLSVLETKINYNYSRIACSIRHSILNCLLEEEVVEETISFSGDDPDDIWKPMISGGLGTGLEDKKLSREKNRRDLLKKTGGLMQTSLAQKVIAMLGRFPLTADYNGNVKSCRFSLPTTPFCTGELSVKNGRVEAVVVINQRVKLKTGIFWIDSAEIPGSAITSLKGKSLRHLIDHDMVTDDMIITSLKCDKGEITGRYKMGESRVSR